MYDGTGGDATDKSTSQPHDALFRHVLGRPENAGSELRSILPSGLVGRIDLDNLIPVPGTFVDKDLTRRHTDLLFRTTVDSHDAYLYVLMEHQRAPDPLMAFRMLTYQTRIWNRHLAEAKRRGQSPTALPPIIPIVIYQGPRDWTAPTDLADLIDVDPSLATELGDLLPHIRYQLDNLTAVDDDALRARPLTTAARITFVFLKRAPDDPDALRWLPDWLDELKALASDSRGQPLPELLQYLVVSSNTPRAALHEFATRIGPQAEEVIVTTGQQLIAEGRAEGQTTMLLRLLSIRFGELDDHTRTRVRSATPEQLDTWSTRFAEGAASLSDVLG